MPVPEHVSVAIHVQRVYLRAMEKGNFQFGKAAQTLFDKACGVVEAYMAAQEAAVALPPEKQPTEEEMRKALEDYKNNSPQPQLHPVVSKKRDMWSGSVPKFAQQPPPSGYRQEMTEQGWLISLGFVCGTDSDDWCYPSWENPTLVVGIEGPGQFSVASAKPKRALSRDELGRLLDWCKPAAT